MINSHLISIGLWITTILSLVGVVLNIYKKKECFIVWSVTNLTWCIVDFIMGLYQQAVLFFVYFVLAIIGLIKWWREQSHEQK